MDSILKPGDIVRGRWTGNRFIVKAIIEVNTKWELYKVQALPTGLFFALKVSGFIPDLSYEFRIIRDLNKKENIRQTGLIPQVYILDDFLLAKRHYRFYVMDVPCGERLCSLLPFLREREMGWLFYQLSSFLHKLQSAGWEFTNLHPASIFVDSGQAKLVVVDFTELQPCKNLSQNLARLENEQTRWLLNYDSGKDGLKQDTSLETAKTQIVVNAVGIFSFLLFLGSIIYTYF